jgi:two-component system sensor histidine kinase YesM
VVSLVRRFNIAFILLVGIPALLVSVILSQLYLSALFSTVAGQTEAVVEQITQNINNEVDGVSILTSALFHDLELRSLADAYARARNPGEKFLASNRLGDKLVSFFTYSNRVGEVILSMKDGQVYTYQNYSKTRSIGRIDPETYARARGQAGEIYLLDQLTGPTGNQNESMLSLVVCTSAQDYDTQIDAVMARFRVPYFDNLRSRPASQAAGDVIIYGRDGRVLLTSLPQTTGLDSPGALESLRQNAEDSAQAGPAARGAPAAFFRQVRFAGRTWLASSLRMDSTGWTVVVLVDKAAITGRITAYQWYLYPGLALLVVLFFLYVHLITVEREERERARMKAEVEALRFQIDPHFVSNTLNSIRLMARAAKADGIADMTQSLMRVLSDSYASSGPMTTLAHEISSVASYVGIMKIRFAEIFDVSWNIAPETQDLLVLKMILQPIMENAILHGISPAGRRGAISISSHLESAPARGGARIPEPGLLAVPGMHLVIEARDDGVGMSQELAASVLHPENGQSAGNGGLHRIGLANVHQRIRLNFGEPFGLQVESVPGVCTLIRYVLPAVRSKDA